MPVLLLADGYSVLDSSVICEYFDQLHVGRKLIPESGRDRFSALRMAAIADGLSDAGIAVRWETERRPEHLRYPPLRDGQISKLVAGYEFLERDEALDGPVTVGHIALATSLSWLEFRHLPSFRIGHPRLVDWYEGFCQRPSMLATPLSGMTHD